MTHARTITAETVLATEFALGKTTLDHYWLTAHRERHIVMPTMIHTDIDATLTGSQQFCADDWSVTIRWQAHVQGEHVTLSECHDDPLFELEGATWSEPGGTIPDRVIEHLLATPGWREKALEVAWPQLATRLYEQIRASRPESVSATPPET